MIKVIGPRGTGKTTKLFELARENNAMILTSNSRAMRENVLVDNADDVLNCLINKFYSIKVIGYTATINENEKRN